MNEHFAEAIAHMVRRRFLTRMEKNGREFHESDETGAVEEYAYPQISETVTR